VARGKVPAFWNGWSGPTFAVATWFAACCMTTGRVAASCDCCAEAAAWTVVGAVA